MPRGMTLRPVLLWHLLLWRVWRDARAGVGVFVALAMPLLAGFAAFAVDLGTVQLDARRLQGVADAAALAAAGDPAKADAVARGLVAASWDQAAVVRVVPGRYRADAGIPLAQRFVADAAGDAAQVQVTTRSPTFFAKVFGIDDVPIVRQATAQRRAVTSFSVGSRLVGLDGGVLNALLSALTGRPVTLGVLDQGALVSANVDMVHVLDRVRVRANMSGADYATVLSSEVQVGDVLAALTDTLNATGQGTAGGAVGRIGAAVGGQTIKLGTLIDAGPLAHQAGAGGLSARVPVLAFTTAVLQSGGARRLSLDLGAGVPGVASLKMSVAIGERAQSSPWLAITDKGDTIVRTAQARIYARARLAPTLLPGLSSLASVDLPLFVEAAGAEARLKSIDCAATPRSVTLEGRVSPVQAAIGSVDEAQLGDFSRAITPSSARLVDTLLVDVTGSSRVSLGAAEPWQTRRFTQAMIDAGSTETIRSTTPVQGIAASLIQQASLKVSLVGLPIAIDPLLRAVGTLLSGVAGPIDTVLSAVTGTLGVGIGEGDLQVNGLRCSNVVLVG
ncbi:pilus assembly protein TadG-related protein [uncultured Sphingomonas sp.]|uniref:pilus assembly protein TadG-related protein n=1 Tax=uncultured Sphingomonas sp. TaxID=158754 RepID=UPI00260DBCB5|nr:pilus assembly protein TadG-related protein [uncultured Sphingomonas sp.]